MRKAVTPKVTIAVREITINWIFILDWFCCEKGREAQEAMKKRRYPTSTKGAIAKSNAPRIHSHPGD